MKTAISMPDDLFRRVDRAAKRRGISRSELLARAARAFLEEERGRDVTASYDRAFAAPTDAEPYTGDARFVREAARRALHDVEW